MPLGYSNWSESAGSVAGFADHLSAAVAILTLLRNDSAAVTDVAFNHFARRVRNLPRTFTFTALTWKCTGALAFRTLNLTFAIARLTCQLVHTEKLLL
jgi:hypothetical protein